MNPNSAHQLWSLWTFTVHPQYRGELDFEVIKSNCARFGRKAFGGASQMWVGLDRYDTGLVCVVKVRTEGSPINDTGFVEYMVKMWGKFFRNGFGEGSRVLHEVKWEAGDRGDGRPPDQLIILPLINLNTRK